MKKLIALLFAFSLSVVSMQAAEEQNLEGTLSCAKCKLKEAGVTACADVLTVGDVKYYLEEGGKVKTSQHQCSGEAKAKVTGKVEDREGKKFVVVSKIEKEES